MQKHKNTGNFLQLPVYTGAPVFLRGTWAWAHCPLLPQMQILPLPMEGKGYKKSRGGGSGVLSAPCDQDATLYGSKPVL